MHARTAFLTAALACAAGFAHADGLSALEAFVKSARNGRAEFTQTVTAPPRDGQAARSRNSTGSFAFQRPARFRFDYRQPFPQVIVADGQTLWLHDVDLNQVTARNQAVVLSATPAALVASAPDLVSLQRDFELRNAPDRDGLEWVQATPKARDGQVASVLVGLRGNALAVLEILDSFGQRSVLRFDKLELNVALPPGTFEFKPPAGTSVLRQP